jgi:hypothetical protein
MKNFVCESLDDRVNPTDVICDTRRSQLKSNYRKIHKYKFCRKLQRPEVLCLGKQAPRVRARPAGGRLRVIPY